MVRYGQIYEIERDWSLRDTFKAKRRRKNGVGVIGSTPKSSPTPRCPQNMMEKEAPPQTLQCVTMAGWWQDKEEDGGGGRRRLWRARKRTSNRVPKREVSGSKARERKKMRK